MCVSPWACFATVEKSVDKHMKKFCACGSTSLRTSRTCADLHRNKTLPRSNKIVCERVDAFTIEEREREREKESRKPPCRFRIPLLARRRTTSSITLQTNANSLNTRSTSFFLLCSDSDLATTSYRFASKLVSSSLLRFIHTQGLTESPSVSA